MAAPFRFTLKDWRSAKVHVASTLLRIARDPNLEDDRRNISYEDLTLSIRDVLLRVKIPRRGVIISTLLNQVSQASFEIGDCWITSLVVRKDFNRPGEGLEKWLHKRGKTLQDVLAEQRAAVSFLRSERAEELLRRLEAGHGLT